MVVFAYSLQPGIMYIIPYYTIPYHTTTIQNNNAIHRNLKLLTGIDRVDAPQVRSLHSSYIRT